MMATTTATATMKAFNGSRTNASVFTDAEKDVLTDAEEDVLSALPSWKMRPSSSSGRGPLLRSQSDRSPSLPKDDDVSAALDGSDRAADDIDSHRRRQTLADFKSSSFKISDSTRRILECMSDGQLADAEENMIEVKRRRSSSGITPLPSSRKLSMTNVGSMLPDGRKLSMVVEQGDNDDEARNRLSGILPSFSDDCLENVDDSGWGTRRRRSSRRSTSSTSSDDGIMERQMSKSITLGGTLLDDFSEGDDDDDDDSDDTEGEWDGIDRRKAAFQAERKLHKMDSLGNESGRGATFMDVAQMDDDDAFEKIVRKHSGGSGSSIEAATVPQAPKPTSQRKPAEWSPAPLDNQQQRRPSRKQRNSLLTQSCTGDRGVSSAARKTKKKKAVWKPLSGTVVPKMDDEYDDEDQEEDNSTLKKEKAASSPTNNNNPNRGKGIGSLWNKLTSSFTEPPSTTKKTKEIDGATYFRRGKRKADKGQFLQAVALYNFALVRQRQESGENHIDCGTTLNEIGVCWMMMGERYPAMTAFEEALFIRQKNLGDGSMEVCETTNNIWMMLHEERQEAEGAMEEGNGMHDII